MSEADADIAADEQAETIKAKTVMNGTVGFEILFCRENKVGQKQDGIEHCGDIEDFGCSVIEEDDCEEAQYKTETKISLVFPFESGQMNKLREAKADDSDNFVCCPDKKGVGEECEQDCESQSGVAVIFGIGIGDADEDADIFENRRADCSGIISVEQEKCDVYECANCHPLAISVGQFAVILPEFFKHNYYNFSVE